MRSRACRRRADRELGQRAQRARLLHRMARFPQAGRRRLVQAVRAARAALPEADGAAGLRRDRAAGPCAYEISTSASAIAAGSACTQRILRLTVAAPKAPATITHARKKTFTGSPAKNPQISPAARKPLYRP